MMNGDDDEETTRVASQTNTLGLERRHGDTCTVRSLYGVVTAHINQSTGSHGRERDFAEEEIVRRHNGNKLQLICDERRRNMTVMMLEMGWRRIKWLTRGPSSSAALLTCSFGTPYCAAQTLAPYCIPPPQVAVLGH